MEICLYCEHYNPLTQTCELTNKKKLYDESCPQYEHTYTDDDMQFDWDY